MAIISTFEVLLKSQLPPNLPPPFNKAISSKDFTLRLRSGCKLAERSRRQRVICLPEIA